MCILICITVLIVLAFQLGFKANTLTDNVQSERPLLPLHKFSSSHSREIVLDTTARNRRRAIEVYRPPRGLQKEYGVYIEYGPQQNPRETNFKKWKASYARATFSAIYKPKNKLKKVGSRAYSRLKPPGWDEYPCDFTRGHLLAHSLGGNGRLTKNIVALCQEANNYVMSEWEQAVLDVKRQNLHEMKPYLAAMQYTVQAVYCDGRHSPAALWLQALVKRQSNDTFSEWLRVLIPNEKSAKGILYIDQSHQLGLHYEKKKYVHVNNVEVLDGAPINEILTADECMRLNYPPEPWGRSSEEPKKVSISEFVPFQSWGGSKQPTR
ncbi:DNA/RNA non-specific endonuclease [Gracilaria domingensis]|nr:DNA/RNA non-specific endonuclease [Gracilaria domingensis]